MSWNDDDDDDSFIWFPDKHVAGEKPNYFAWHETFKQLGFSEDQFDAWWKENREIDSELETNEVLQRIIKNYK